ncbi:hypothetical protein [Cystobacter ferrugineus]|uniref:Uncharacterized protein n=1 Tax=Cystobacter ferrugineus TaxID=83449 RepID=A0A1L9B346_9BACT|nr:hypothetical protein [Cystobacter ferrugineus]OJH36603.1 hypothetical protein BON30_33145 [Cystobacter ferrugineus]
MANHDIGHCKDCRYFNSKSMHPSGSEIAQCRQPELQDFDLLVAGDCGCNAFEARAESDISRGMPMEEPSPMVH